jgi:hypothetical protein
MEMNARSDAASMASPWGRKPHTVAFRGSTTGVAPSTPADLSINPRLHLALLAKEHRRKNVGRKEVARHPSRQPNWDVGVTKLVQVSPEVAAAIVAAGLQLPDEQFVSLIRRARGLFDVDGNVNSWSGLWWKLRSNSVTIKVESSNKQWYYDKLKPWVHYVPVAANMSDLDAAVHFVLDSANDNALKAIARASTRFIKNLTYAHETNKVRHALERCFSTGVCSPEQGRSSTKRSDVLKLSSEDALLLTSFNEALLKGIGVLIQRDPRLWSALERAASCHLHEGS